VSANGVTAHHAVTLVYVSHVSVIVLYNGWFQSVYMLITKITFCWRTTYIHQNVLFPLSFHTIVVKSSLNLVIMSSHFSLSSLQKSLGIPFLFGLTVPHQFMASVRKSSNKSRKEKKLSMQSLHSKFSILVLTQLHELWPVQQLHISCLCLNTLTCCMYIA
jgi:hypothetical protein